MSEKDLPIYGPFDLESSNNQSELSEVSKKNEDDEFDLDDADIFVDESSPMLNHLSKCEEPLIGMDMIIDDQTHDNLKCILCRVLLRDRYAIIEHLKDVRHQSLFMERYHPVVYNCLAERHESAAKFCELINQYSVELAKEQGRKCCRTYVKGHGDKVQNKAESSSKNDSRHTSTSKKGSNHSHHKSRSRSRDRKHKHRSRSPIAHGSHTGEARIHHHGDRQYRRHHSSDDDDKDSRSSHKGQYVEKAEEEDVYGELAPDQKITNALFAAKLAEFGPNEKAFVHNEIAYVKRPIVGLDFVAEYGDPQGIYQPGYLCVICDARFSPAQILNHVASEKHRLRFMERRFKTYYATVTLKTLPEETRKDLIHRYSRDIEIQEGRGNIKRKILIDESNRFIFKNHKPISAPVAAPRKYPLRERESVAPLPFDPSKISVIDRAALPPPPKLRAMYTRVPQPQRPNFIYSEKVEKQKQLAEIEKVLPPFVEKNVENGWYSVRQFSLEYYQRLVPPMTPFISLRCPNATHEIYGSWSPYVMRRIQDQFNFTLDHLTWLQKLLLDWHIPLSKPLEDHELRPLADDVELAVLRSMVGQVLQPNNFLERIHERVVFEYNDRANGTSSTKTKFETIEYGREEVATRGDQLVAEMPQKFVRERRPSTSSVGSSGPVASISQPPRAQSILLTPTPSEDDQRSLSSAKRATSNERAVAERAMIALIDQVLQTAKESKINNPILNLILSFDNARSILFALATKQPATLQQLVVVMKNPALVVPPEMLSQVEKKLRDIAGDIELCSV